MKNALTSPTNERLMKIVSLVALAIFMPFFLIVANEIAVLITRASGTPANIVVETKITSGPLDINFYHAFAQGGEETGNMLQPVMANIRTLKPKLIRLDHLYDYYNVVSNTGGQLSFNWTALDSVIDTILATGAKPLLALSYMPSVIAKDGNIINPPNNWNDWALVIQKTIEHYSGKNARNLSGVYYEVWNEPDLAQFGGWKYGGNKNYITLYQYASVGARNAQQVNPFFLGGPATTGLYKSWIIALIKSGARIDFFSWHTYQADPKKYTQDQQDIIKWLLPYPNYTLLPTLVTEFGFTGNKSPAYGGTYATAFTAAVIRQVISGGPQYAFSFQLKDGPGQQEGNGWGLIAHEDNDNKLKPRYYIYSFLDSMAGNRVTLSGEGTWVTGFASRTDNTVRVMLVNFNPNGSHSETVPVTFTSLDPGTYSYHQKFFLGTDVTITETVTTDTLTKKIFMPTSSVVLLELTKK
jgi:hypothetical protein